MIKINHRKGKAWGADEMEKVHAHWKMEECHNAYWEFVPTVDHIYPVALG